MDDEGTEAPHAPGWDADPYGRHEQRYWDGAGWTDQVRDGEVTGTDPVVRMSPWAAMGAATPTGSDATGTREPSAAPAPGPPVGPASTPAAAPTPSAAPPPAPATAPAPPTAAAPTPRPAGPGFGAPVGAPPAWDAPVTLTPSALATAPAPAGSVATAPPPSARPMAPAPAWGPPPSPYAPPPPPIGGLGDLTPMPKRTSRRRWWVLAAACLVVIVVGGSFVLNRGPSRIDAGPPAPAPAGYRVVDGEEYRFAVPASWVTQEVTSEARDQLKEDLERRAPGLAESLDESESQIDGTMTIAIDPVTRDNVTVIRNHWMRGDPTDPDTLANIQTDVDSDFPHATVSGLRAEPADVHGFPAATLTFTATVGSLTAHEVMTIIQTGDHVFQVTVTASSAARAAELSSRIVPTFDPV